MKKAQEVAVPAGLRLEYASLDTIQPATRNPKKHSGDISTSISRFGYVEPIVVDERTGRIVAGHGRREALLKLRADKESPPAGVREVNGEWQVQVLRGWSSRSDTEAEAYLVASNRLTEVGGWDEGALTELLRELQASDALVGVGFSEKDLELLAMKSMPLTDPEAEWKGMPEFDQEDQMAYRTVKVHFKTEEAVQEFAELVGQTVSLKTKFIWHPEAERADVADQRYVADDDVAE